MYATRLWIALGSLTWSILLFWPGDLFVNRPTYKLMAAVAGEHALATAFLVHSMWALYTLLTRTRNHVTLAMDAFLGFILWTSSTLLCFAAHWPHSDADLIDKLIAYPMPAAMSGELWLSIASFWHLIRYWAEEEK